ncbi:MAG: ATP-binding protein [Cognatishimia activa]
MQEQELQEILATKDGRIFRREGRTLEFKEQFNFAALADYYRDFAAFANNKGGCLVFGVTDSPRLPAGISVKSKDAFEKIDPETITGHLGNIFSSEVAWEAVQTEIDGKHFAAFKIQEASIKPIVALKDEGKDQTIKNGDIYYRYGGRTQRILSAELQAIINSRIDANNRAWIEHVQSIGISGPQNAFVLRNEESLADRPEGPLVIDGDLASKLKFVKEGKFQEKEGAETLRLVGDVVPVNAVEIERKVEENVFQKFPFSAKELAAQVKLEIPTIKQHEIWSAIEESGLKGDEQYSRYNFRNLRQKDEYLKSGKVPRVTPVIYNTAALTLLVNLLRQK